MKRWNAADVDEDESEEKKDKRRLSDIIPTRLLPVVVPVASVFSMNTYQTNEPLFVELNVS